MTDEQCIAIMAAIIFLWEGCESNTEAVDRAGVLLYEVRDYVAARQAGPGAGG